MTNIIIHSQFPPQKPAHNGHIVVSGQAVSRNQRIHSGMVQHYDSREGCDAEYGQCGQYGRGLGRQEDLLVQS